MDTLDSRYLDLERVMQISLELTSTLSLGDLLHRIAHAAADLTNTESAGILLKEDDAEMLRFIVATTYEDQLLNIPVPIHHSIAGACYLSGEALLVADAARDPRHFKAVEENTGFKARSLLCAPLCYRETMIGVLEVENKRLAGGFDNKDIAILSALAAYAAIAIHNARLYQQAQDEIAQRARVEAELRRHRHHLEELVQERSAELIQTLARAENINQQLQAEITARRHVEEELRVAAVTDALTSVYNRRELSILGQQMFQHALLGRQPLAAMMLDADHFKKINDTFGHAVGDEALKRLAQLLKTHLRSTDIIGRYGGEEFVALMPETNLEAAQEMGQRLLVEIRGLALETPLGQARFTVSIGMACLQPGQDLTADDLVDRADQAMYAAKQAGRDRIAISEAGP